MKWSWKIGTFRGIGVYIHTTFLLLLAFLALSSYMASGSVAAAIAGVAFFVLLFGCILLHEFGHALAAARYGIKTRDITLLPIGGLARLEQIPEDPRQELVVAAAGPLVNVVIAAGLYGWLAATGALVPIEQLGMSGGPFLERLMYVNIFIVVFNLIPAFPMDGGRMLRALLAMRIDYVRATQVAASVGQALAFVFGFIGLFSNPWLLFIAFFVWIGAAQEASMVQMKGALGGIPLQTVMITDFHTLAPSDTLAHAVELTLAGAQKDFPVTDNGEIVGVLTQTEMLRALHTSGPETPVRDAMATEFATAERGEMMERVLLRLQTCNCRTLPVTERGRLVGLVTMENVGEFLQIQAALGGPRTARPVIPATA